LSYKGSGSSKVKLNRRRKLTNAGTFFQKYFIPAENVIKESATKKITQERRKR